MAVTMRVVVTSTSSGNTKTLVHGDKDHEANHDSQAKHQVAVGLDQHKLLVTLVVLANENLGQKVEQRVAKKTTNSEGDHDGQRRRVNVGRAQRQEEVGRTRDVQSRKEGIDSGRTGEQDRKDLRSHRRGRMSVFGGLVGIELLDNGTALRRHVS